MPGVPTRMYDRPVKALGLPWNNWKYTDVQHLQITVFEKRYVAMWLAVFGETVEVRAGGPPENFVVASAAWDADAVLITLEAVS